MSKIVKRYFFSWQEEKEKAFLEKMAKEGYRLSGAELSKYKFNACPPADLIYEIDFKGEDFEDVDEYLQIHQDAGWLMVADKGGWFYFCKERSEDMNNNLFNDNTSKLQKYRRLLGYVGSLWCLTVYFIWFTIGFVRKEAVMSELAMNLVLLSAFIIPGILFFRIWLKYHHLKSKISE